MAVLDLFCCPLYFFLHIYQWSYASEQCIAMARVFECCFHWMISSAFGFRYVSSLRGFFFIHSLRIRWYNGRQVLVCWIEWMERQRHRPTISISITSLLEHCMIRFMQNKLLYLWNEAIVAVAVGQKHTFACTLFAGCRCHLHVVVHTCRVRRRLSPSAWNEVINLWHKCSLTNRK